MRSATKALCIALAFLLLLAPLSACTKPSPPAPVTPPEEVFEPAPPEEPPEDEIAESPNPIPEGPVNPLTGLADGLSEEAAARRPAAVMINNLKQAIPQLGISKADIIYEMMAEGRIYRMLAVFQDPSRVGRIGSVRSARPYFVDMAENHNAVFFHIGASVPGYEALRSRKNVLSFDGIVDGKAEIYYRDAERKKKNHALIAGMSVLLVWFVAVLAFAATDIFFRNVSRHWLILVYAVPVSMIVWLVFNSVWFNRRRNYLIISLLMWSLLAAVHVTVLTFNYNIWLIYTPGIPGQIIIFLWSKLSFWH